MASKQQLEQLMESLMNRVQAGEIPAGEVMTIYHQELKKLSSDSPKNVAREMREYMFEQLESRDVRKLFGVLKSLVDSYPYDLYDDNPEFQKYLTERWGENDLDAVLSMIATFTRKAKIQDLNKPKGALKSVSCLPPMKVDDQVYNEYRKSLGMDIVPIEGQELSAKEEEEDTRPSIGDLLDVEETAPAEEEDTVVDDF